MRSAFFLSIIVAASAGVNCTSYRTFHMGGGISATSPIAKETKDEAAKTEECATGRVCEMKSGTIVVTAPAESAGTITFSEGGCRVTKELCHSKVGDNPWASDDDDHDGHDHDRKLEAPKYNATFTKMTCQEVKTAADEAALLKASKETATELKNSMSQSFSSAGLTSPGMIAMLVAAATALSL